MASKSKNNKPKEVAESSPILDKPNRRSPIQYVSLAIIVICLIALTALTVAYFNSRSEVKRLSNPAEANKQQVEDLVAKANRLVDLPKGETPTVATVKDINKLKGQEFFRNAQNGDKVLIYTKAQKAALYRPSTDKIIEVAPVNLGNSSASTTSAR